MPNNIAHFAINADDVNESRRFYENVFGWSFQPWGPPEFFKIDTGDESNSGMQGALQKRRAIVPGERITGYECTISVSSVDEIAAAIEANGGNIVMKKVTIPGVGNLIFFKDPGGNTVGAMEFDKTGG